MRLLSQEEYVEDQGMRCPVCHRMESLVVDSPDVGMSSVFQILKCQTCGSTWTEEFVLTTYSDVDFPRALADFPITAKMFEEAVGSAPLHDDLERCNCPDAGKLRHMQCGWCSNTNSPRFLCNCNECEFWTTHPRSED